MRPAAALLLATSLGLPAAAGAAGDGWRLAARAGLLLPDSSLGPAARVALETAWLPASLGGSLAAVGELSWAAPERGASPSLLGLPVSGWSASATDVALEAALVWRGQGALGPVTPYAWAGLSIHVVRAQVTWLGVPWASTQLRPGLSLRVGAEWKLGSGGPFLELGWSTVTADGGPAGPLELGGFLASGGWRVAL